MECGRYCLVVFTAAFVSFALLVTSVSTPYQLVFVTKPFARHVLGSGHLDSWSAKTLDLEPEEFEKVKQNYQEYLRKNRRFGGDDSDSVESDEEPVSELELGDDHVGHTTCNESGPPEVYEAIQMFHGQNIPTKQYGVELTDTSQAETNGRSLQNRTLVGRRTWTRVQDRMYETGSDIPESSESSDSSESDEGDSEESDEMTIMERLEDQPLQRTISLGLFRSTVCTIQQDFKHVCVDSSIAESLRLLSREIFLIEQEINLPLWNDLRMEYLLAIVACCIGMLCLCATFRPCCISKYAPIYIGAVAFAVSSLVVFIPVVRILMISSDFREMLESELNITSSIGFSWSVLTAGISVPFSVFASVLLVSSKWDKTKRIVKKLFTGGHTNDGQQTVYSGVPKSDCENQGTEEAKLPIDC